MKKGRLEYNIRLRLTGILVYTFINVSISSMQLLLANQQANAQWWLSQLLIAFAPALFMWECNRLLVIYVNKIIPVNNITIKRFLIESFFVILLNATIYFALIPGILWLDGSHPPFLYIVYGAIDKVLYGFFIAGFYEIMLFIQALKKERLEKEELKKINLSIQLESLKSQVKPHFLFNSLNTLTALVEKEPEKAVKFIAELSKVYRYLLQSNEKEIIRLQDELNFTEAYFFLLQMRFGKGISMTVTIADPDRQLMVPPLTLQMLIENAVKHNQVSADKPLRINVGVQQNEWLVVENNLQLKRNPQSNGMGLSNIAAKFRLLNRRGMEVVQDENHFSVTVPLIKLNNE